MNRCSGYEPATSNRQRQDELREEAKKVLFEELLGWVELNTGRELDMAVGHDIIDMIVENIEE